MKVLQFGLSSNHGGVESFVFNYARSLKKNAIVFDYVDILDWRIPNSLLKTEV